MRGGFTHVEDRNFNSSLAFLERIEKRWEDSDQAKIAGSLITYFRSLEVIYRNTHPFFDQPEREEVEALIEKCGNSLSSLGNRGNIVQVALTNTEKYCDELRMKLVSLLFKYKITYYQIEKKDLVTEVDEDFA